MRQALASSTRRAAALLAALAPLALAQPQPQAPVPPPSEAERLVFQQDHLANTRPPRALRYAYVEESEGKPSVTDRAVLTLRPGEGGRCCQVHGEYLSGALAVNLPDIPEARANPVVLYFLEAEVRRLQRTTQGQAAHFRRRIRQSLVDAATVSEATIQWGSRAVPARLVRVAPFLDDPFRPRFQEQAATEYSFLLSEAVPGGVYQLRATLPGAAAGALPRALRTLTLDDAN